MEWAKLIVLVMILMCSEGCNLLAGIINIDTRLLQSDQILNILYVFNGQCGYVHSQNGNPGHSV